MNIHEYINKAMSNIKNNFSHINSLGKKYALFDKINGKYININAQKQLVIMGKNVKLPVVFSTIGVVLLSCFVGFLGFGENSEISMVKNGTLSYDNSIEIGKLLENYTMIKKSEWKLLEDSRGKRIVEFRGIIDNNYIAKQRFMLMLSEKNGHTLPSESEVNEYSYFINSFSSSLDSEFFKLELIAQFSINVDNKGFQLSYIGWDYKGKTTNSTNTSLNNFISNIYGNKIINVLGVNFDYSADLAWRLSKFILTNTDYKNFLILGSVDKSKYSNSNIIPSIDSSPIIVAKIENFEFDENNRAIYANVDFSILDIFDSAVKETKDKILDIKGYKEYNDIVSIISNGHSLQHIKKRLYKDFNSSHKVTTSFAFSSEKSDKDFAGIAISFEPNNTTFKQKGLGSQDAVYRGNLDVSILKLCIDKFNNSKTNQYFEGDGIHKGKYLPRSEMKQSQNTYSQLADNNQIAPEQSNLPINMNNIQSGKYKYKEDGLDGDLELVNGDNDNTFKVKINTVNNNTLSTCEFEANCKKINNEIICIDNEITKEDLQAEGADQNANLKISFVNHGMINVATNYPPTLFCGRGAYFEGKYVLSNSSQ